MKLHCCEVEGRGSYLDPLYFQQDVTAEKDMKWRRRDHGFANVEENTFFSPTCRGTQGQKCIPVPDQEAGRVRRGSTAAVVVQCSLRHCNNRPRHVQYFPY